jgi:plastocyanin
VRSQRATRAGRYSIPTVVVLAVGLIALAGCGGSSSGSSSSSSSASTPASTASSTPAPATSGTSGGQTLSLEANREGQLKYNTSSLTAKAGTVSIDFTNMAPLAHTVNVASASGAVLGATPAFQGGSKTVTLKQLAPGTYKFYCTQPGHRMAGMEGTLTVH